MPDNQPPPSPSSNSATIIFMMILSFVCALILSILASSLRPSQEVARALDQSQQMMMAARIVSPSGYFQVEEGQHEYVPAIFSDGILKPSDKIQFPTGTELFQIYKDRLKPMLLNQKNELITFEEAGIDEQEYVTENRKRGYYKMPLKLIYEIYPNQKSENDAKPIGYVIPVNGYGLWDAIYGYLAIKTDGDTVIGIAWYDQKETPGLGAVITETAWQNQFIGKKIFEESPDGETDFKTAPLGITVVRGEVKNVYGNKPKARSAVDGIPGATLTGNGVTAAYEAVLAPYRAFLIKLHEESQKNGN